MLSNVVRPLLFFLNGEPETAKLTLRDLINVTMCLEGLAFSVEMPAKSVHRVLSFRQAKHGKLGGSFFRPQINDEGRYSSLLRQHFLVVSIPLADQKQKT